MSAIIIQDEIVHYEVLGRGRPVIFTHGWVGSWRYWIPSMQAASTSFRAYALDLWGFGDTAREPGKYLLNEQAALLGDFLFEMGIQKTALIGHGLGAIVSLLFAKKFPQTVDRVMAICMPFSSDALNPRLQQAPPGELANWLMGETPESQAARAEAVKTDQDAILRSIYNLQNIEIERLATETETPSLLVFGKNDPAITLTTNGDLFSLPERVHSIVFDDSGHFPMMDQVNKFNRLMIDFLSLPSGESPRQLQLKDEWKRRIR